MIVAFALLFVTDVGVSLALLARDDVETPMWVLLHLAVCVAAGWLGAARHALTGRDRTLLALFLSAIAIAALPIGVVGLYALSRWAFAAHAPIRPPSWQVVRPTMPKGAPLRLRWQSPPSPFALKEALSHREPEATDRRFEAVLKARALSPRDAIGVLREALRDPSEEIRLFAFTRIERFRGELEATARDLERVRAGSARPGGQHLLLAQTYHELAYLGLVEGAVRARVLEQARQHAEQALVSFGDRASAHWTLGRVELELGHASEARSHFERAIATGFSRRKVVPYLAECAFRRRRFAEVREHMVECAAMDPEPSLWPLVETWT